MMGNQSDVLRELKPESKIKSSSSVLPFVPPHLHNMSDKIRLAAAKPFLQSNSKSMTSYSCPMGVLKAKV